MKIKVCGITNPEQLAALQTNFAGLIFFEGSTRYVPFSKSSLFKESVGPLRIGVFVNADFETITKHIEAFDLWGIQLHGEESPELAAQLKPRAFVIKVIGINEKGFTLDPSLYENSADYFLFDSAGKSRGGTGEKFDWNILTGINKPFFLAGGIGPDDAEHIKKLNLPYLFSLDLNSRFETAPGIKDLSLVNKFIEEVSE